MIIALYIAATALPIIVPLLLLAFVFKRSSRKYRYCWLGLSTAMAAVSLIAFAYVMQIPLHSQVSHQTTSPGGPSGDYAVMLLTLLFIASIVIPSFPVLLLLGLFPPRSYRRSIQWTIRFALPMAAILMATMIYAKRQAHQEDYRRFKKGPRQPAVSMQLEQRHSQERFLKS